LREAAAAVTGARPGRESATTAITRRTTRAAMPAASVRKRGSFLSIMASRATGRRAKRPGDSTGRPAWRPSRQNGHHRAGKVLGDVVVEHDREQRQDHQESDLQDPLLDAQREIAPDESFDSEQEEMSAVEHRDRKEIEDPELQGDRRHQRDQGIAP
jgi:hypothetical protein